MDELSDIFCPCPQHLKHAQPINENSSHPKHQQLIILAVKCSERLPVKTTVATLTPYKY